jgi:hypothetical protein
MIEIRFDKTKDEVALLIWFLVDHSVFCHCGYEGCYVLNKIKVLSDFFFLTILRAPLGPSLLRPEFGIH